MEGDGGESVGINTASSGAKRHIADMQTITDEEANTIYQKISGMTQSRKGYIKKNWSEDETRLLKWAVLTYTKQKSITYQNLVSS